MSNEFYQIVLHTTKNKVSHHAENNLLTIACWNYFPHRIERIESPTVSWYFNVFTERKVVNNVATVHRVLLIEVCQHTFRMSMCRL